MGLTEAATDPQVLQILPTGVKVKRMLRRQRACNEKNEKGKICAGHLKRWYFYEEEIRALLSADESIYRCERCKTLYVPDSTMEPRSATLVW